MVPRAHMLRATVLAADAAFLGLPRAARRVMTRLGTAASPASSLSSSRSGLIAPGKDAVVGPLRSLPRWTETAGSAVDAEMQLISGDTPFGHLYSAALRFEEGRSKRVAEFGTTKQWKTLSAHEAMSQYMLSPRDLKGLGFVAKYNVHGTARFTRFYVVFDVQNRALERWGDAVTMRAAQARRRATRERRVARLRSSDALMLLRPVRARKGVVVVGARAVTAAIVGNTGVVLAKLAGWSYSGSGALLSEAFHSLADLGNQVMLGSGQVEGSGEGSGEGDA